MTMWHVDGNLLTLTQLWLSWWRRKAARLGTCSFPWPHSVQFSLPSNPVVHLLFYTSGSQSPPGFFIGCPLPQCLWEYSATVHSCGLPWGKCLGTYAHPSDPEPWLTAEVTKDPFFSLAHVCGDIHASELWRKAEWRHQIKLHLPLLPIPHLSILFSLLL